MLRSILGASLAVPLGVTALTFTTPAAACGAVVSPTSVVVQTQQRVFLSLRDDGTTQIVIQLAIPEASEPFGALTPVPDKPTVNPNPVPAEEFFELDMATRPTVSAADSGGGCGCGSSAVAGDKSGGGVEVVQIVDVGPVTAAVLGATDVSALQGWLGDNGFVVPAAHTKILDAYVGTGKYFLAFKRSSAAGSGATSVGVSFSVPGDRRGYPLRMSRIGAAESLGIQVYVAAPKTVAPTGSAPAGNFETLTLDDLDPALVSASYSDAVAKGVSKYSGKAFVIEGVYDPATDWRSHLGTELSSITDPDQVLARFSTVIPSAELTEDVPFDGAAPKNVPTGVHAGATPILGPGRGGDSQRWLYVSVFALAGAALGLRTLSRKPRRSSLVLERA